MARTDEHLVGIDIGSSKVSVLIAQPAGDGGLEVVGKGQAPNRGTRKGNIVNIEATVDALRQATEEAEVMAGVEIARAWVGVAGSDVRSVNVRGMVSVARKDREVTRQDIERVMEAAQSAALPSDREILHAIPQEFLIDDQGGIGDPLGMLGSRLEVAVHLVTANTTRIRTVLTCVNRAGIEVSQLVFEPLCAAQTVLTHDERELGVVLLDVGAGTTNLALFADGQVQCSAVLPVGAGHFTNDLAMVLRTPFAEAERIKLREGCCIPAMVDDREGVTVPAVAGGAERVVPKSHLCEILAPRAEELLTLARETIDRNGWERELRGGLVLTGGGAQLDGLLELAQQIFEGPVRYGLPAGLSGLVDVISSPAWSVSSGVLLYARTEQTARPQTQRRPGFSVRGVVGSIRGMFADLL
ncbi:MAG: cell division protein FtsA [Thermoanaerobaculia bacterium]